MKNLRTLKVLLPATLAFGLVFTSCKKEKQQVNNTPAVMSVDWFGPSVNGGSEWRESSGPLGKEIYIENTNNDITEGVIKNSVILIYAKLKGYDSTVWAPNHVALLPINLTYKKDKIEYTDFWSASFTPGKIRITFLNSGDLYSTADLCTESRFRCVIINKNGSRASGNASEIAQGSILAQYSESDLRSMSYDQVMKITGLKR